MTTRRTARPASGGSTPTRRLATLWRSARRTTRRRDCIKRHSSVTSNRGIQSGRPRLCLGSGSTVLCRFIRRLRDLTLRPRMRSTRLRSTMRCLGGWRRRSRSPGRSSSSSSRFRRSQRRLRSHPVPTAILSLNGSLRLRRRRRRVLVRTSRRTATPGPSLFPGFVLSEPLFIHAGSSAHISVWTLLRGSSVGVGLAEAPRTSRRISILRPSSRVQHRSSFATRTIDSFGGTSLLP